MMTSGKGHFVIRLLSATYGPYAFGVICLLVIWQLVVNPALASNRIDHEQLAQISMAQTLTADSLKETTRRQESLGAVQERTAAILDRALDRLERVSDRLERMADRGNNK